MSELTLADVIEGYWLERRRHLRPDTIVNYEHVFKTFGAFVGIDKPFKSIQAAHVRAWFNAIEPNYSPKSMANKWIVLSALWTWAAKELGCDHVIRGKIQQPRPKRRAIEPYTHDQVTAMLAACDRTKAWTTATGGHATSKRATALRDKAILLTLVDTGIRASELCDLVLSDYDAKTGRVLIQHGKGDKARVVYAGEATRRAIWRYLAERKASQPDAPLFATGTGRHIDRNNLFWLIQNLGENAGVPGAGVHRFRHTYAINFLRNGGNVLALQALLGHEQMDTVRIYARLAEVDLASAQRQASPADKWRLG